MKYDNEVKNIVKQQGIPIIDVLQRFAIHADPVSLFPLELFGHYTPEGYHLITEEVLKVIGDK
jgi:hypothetical protein